MVTYSYKWLPTVTQGYIELQVVTYSYIRLHRVIGETVDTGVRLGVGEPEK